MDKGWIASDFSGGEFEKGLYIYILNIGAEREIILISADLLKDDAEVVFS